MIIKAIRTIWAIRAIKTIHTFSEITTIRAIISFREIRATREIRSIKDTRTIKAIGQSRKSEIAGQLRISGHFIVLYILYYQYHWIYHHSLMILLSTALPGFGNSANGHSRQQPIAFPLPRL